MRSLSPDEAELWARVAATIRPLSREREQSSRNGEGIDQAEQRGPPQSSPRKTAASAVREHTGKAAAAGNNPRRTAGTGGCAAATVEPDRMLDLHGMNLDNAWQAIDRGARAGDRDAAIASLLLITGHHRPGRRRRSSAARSARRSTTGSRHRVTPAQSRRCAARIGVTAAAAACTSILRRKSCGADAFLTPIQ